LPFSLFLFVAGLVLLYYVFYANRGNAADIVATWNSLGVAWRLGILVGFAANAVGLGGIFDHLLAPLRRR
jgi:hypothetical protein